MRDPMTRDELDLLRKAPAHWSGDLVYRCKADPRLLVPKRHGGGWTMNMAHRRAQPTLWLFLIGVVALVLLAARLAR